MKISYLSASQLSSYRTLIDVEAGEALSQLRSVNPLFIVKTHYNFKKVLLWKKELPNTYTIFEGVSNMFNAYEDIFPEKTISKESLITFCKGYTRGITDEAASCANIIKTNIACEKCNIEGTAIQDTTVKQAVDILCEAFSEDEGFKEAWTTNIAMAYYDAVYNWRRKYDKSYLNASNVLEVSNIAATAFIYSLCEKDTE